MQQYNIFQAIVMSFYSRKLYRDVAQNWGGKALLYLLMLLALSWIGATIFVQSTLNHSYAKVSAEIVPQIPVLTFKDGKVSTPEAKPYFIVDPSSHKNFAVIDTTGQFTTLEQADTQILLTQTELITQKNENETRIDKIPANFNYAADPKVIDSYLVSYIRLAWLLIFPLCVMAAFIYRLIQVLFYSLFGKLFSLVSGADVKYGKIVQISLIAITPAIVLATIQDIFGVHVPFQALYYFLLSMCYIFYGIWANKK